MAGITTSNNNSSNNSSNITGDSSCATDLGFRESSRLCHMCNNTSRRRGLARCDVCPTYGQTVGLMILGFFVTVIVCVFLISSGIKDAGKVELSENVKKILVNYLQVTAFAQAFPLRWPDALIHLFEFQGAISTAGEHLLSPDCLSNNSAIGAAAQLFYSKQIMFACAPFFVTFISFMFWYLKACKRSTASTTDEDEDEDEDKDDDNQTSGSTFFDKRKNSRSTTSKDKFVLTVSILLYLLFPTLCTQAFKNFHCLTVGGKQYLAADLMERCYQGRHLVMLVCLGIPQVLAFVIGLPVLVLVLLRRNNAVTDSAHSELSRKLSQLTRTSSRWGVMDDTCIGTDSSEMGAATRGLNNHATIVRYGLFYGAYKESAYYWEVVITLKKIAIVALSVFGPSLGTERQAQMVLAVLLVCISLEIAGDPYKMVSERFAILRRLEIATLFVQWSTFWCGTMIFASDDQESEGFVEFLSVIVALLNSLMLIWLIVQFLIEIVVEHRENKRLEELKTAAAVAAAAAAAAAARTGTEEDEEDEDVEEGGNSNDSVILDKLSDFGDSISLSIKRLSYRIMSPAARQTRLRNQTVESSKGRNTTNPFGNVKTTEMTEIHIHSNSGAIKIDDDLEENSGTSTSGGGGGFMAPSPPPPRRQSMSKNKKNKKNKSNKSSNNDTTIMRMHSKPTHEI